MAANAWTAGLVAAVLGLGAAGAAEAATLDFVEIDTSVAILASGTTNYDPVAQLLSFGGVVLVELGITSGATSAVVAAPVDAAGQVIAAPSTDARLDFGVLAGDLVDARFDDLGATLLFRTLSGSAAAVFGPIFTVSLGVGFPLSGPGDLPAGGVDFSSATFNPAIDMTLPPAVIPLPATLPLLLAALGGVTVLRRRTG